MRKYTLILLTLVAAAARLRADVVDPDLPDDPVTEAAAAPAEGLPLLYWLIPLAAGLMLLGFFLMRPKKA